MQTVNNEIFGRTDENGNVMVLMSVDGAAVTRLDADVWPVNSELSACNEHPNGIVISAEDAKKLGIEIEEA